nr:hypothetical protein [Fredinandcohnia onubensis]
MAAPYLFQFLGLVWDWVGGCILEGIKVFAFGWVRTITWVTLDL